jgi:hypothetical protein
MNASADHPAVSTLVGTLEEVQHRLAETHPDRVLALAFQHVDPKVFQALADNLGQLTSSMYLLLQQRHQGESLERLAEVLLPPAPPAPRLLKEAAMVIQARRAVLESGDWVTAAEIAQLAGLSTRNPSAQPNKWKRQHSIFAISHGGVDYFPAYALDREASFRPLKTLAPIIATFAGHKDAWAMAYWFGSDNSFLNGRRPQDLLATAPDRVLAAAADEIQAISHA